MTTLDEFLDRVLHSVEDIALLLSHTPKERQEAWLDGFRQRVRAQWAELFAPTLSAIDIEGMIEDLVVRLRKRRDEIEAASAGRA